MRSNLFVIAALTLASCSHNTAVQPESSVQQTPPQLTREQIQQNVKEAGTPSAGHAVLKQLEGNWKVESKLWIDPEGQPEVSKGKASNKMILGGRYLTSTFKGTMMGKPFEGQSLTGYDNVSKKYFSTWVDSMNTGLFKSEGSANADNSQITLDSTFTCPVTRAPLHTEERLTIVDKNHYKFESFIVRGEKHDRNMEIDYTRAK